MEFSTRNHFLLCGKLRQSRSRRAARRLSLNWTGRGGSWTPTDQLHTPWETGEAVTSNSFCHSPLVSGEWRNREVFFLVSCKKKPHHWLKFRKTLTYLAIALIATVAAPQVAHCLNISCHKYQSQISQTSKLLWKSMLIVQIFQVINKTIDYYEKRGEKKWSHELFKHITIIGRNSGDCKWQKIFIQCHCWVGIMSRKPIWKYILNGTFPIFLL